MQFAVKDTAKIAKFLIFPLLALSALSACNYVKFNDEILGNPVPGPGVQYPEVPINRAPVATAQSGLTVNDNATLDITLSASDEDGDSLSYAVVASPLHGSLSGTAPDLVYTPNLPYNGSDSFAFKANDGKEDSEVASIAITVTHINHAPVATAQTGAQSVSVNSNTATAITLAGTDEDSDSLTYSIVASPAHGSLSGSAPNLSYTPANGYSGADLFTFMVNDGTVDSATAIVSISVSPNSSAWRVLSPLLPRSNHSAVEIDGKMYVFGGYPGNNYLNDLHVYDPASGEWTDISTPASGTPPSVRAGHSAVAINGKMYVFGGYDNSSGLTDLYVYDPASGGSWTDLSSPTSGSPPSAREFHSAVAIDGKMYIFGGWGSNELHVYDPANGGSWTDLSTPTNGSPPSARNAHSASVIDGKMYIFGGYNNGISSDLNDLYVYDPASGEWTDLSSSTNGSPSARSAHSAVVINGKIYVYGGSVYNGPSNELHVYDPASGEWTDLSTPTNGSPAPARVQHTTSAINGKIYVYGGYTLSGGGSMLNDLHVYDPVSAEWTDISTPTSDSPPSARTGHTAVEINGKMYIFGGYASSNYLNDLHVYDPASGGSWTDLSSPTSGSPPSARFYHTASVIDGKMYVFGGYTDSGGGSFLNDLHVYDPASGEWTDISTPTNGSPPSARSDHSAVEIDGKMYIFGGWNNSNQNDLYVYDPASGGSWTDLSSPTNGSPPSARFDHSAVEINGKMYIFGGADLSGYLNDLRVYDPASGEWTDISTPTSGSTPSARQYFSAVVINGKIYFFGGWNNSNQNDLYVYDPASGGSWTDLSSPTNGSPPSARFSHSAVQINGKMYVFGGYNNSAYFNDLHEYSIE